MSTHQPVETGKVPGRRTLKFATTADIRRDLAAIESAHHAGKLSAIGNWTPGQNFCHLASFINYAYDGYPPAMKQPPWILRLILKPMKNKFLYKAMPAGVKIPGVPTGTVGADESSFDDGLARLRAALDRLDQNAPTVPNAIFGPMTHDEWKNLQMRHCELHLSFLTMR